MGKKGGVGRPKATRQTRKVKTEEGQAEPAINMEVTQTKDFHRRNNQLRANFSLPTNYELARAKAEEVKAEMMDEDQPLAISTRPSKSVLNEDEAEEPGTRLLKEQIGRAKASTSRKRSSGGASSGSSGAKTGGTQHTQTYVEELSREHEDERSKEEEAANNLGASTLDKSQYFPILLDYDDENGAGAVHRNGVEEPGSGEGSDRQDMNGAMAAERVGLRSRGDILAKFSEQDGEELIENGNNFILFQFPVELPELPKSMEGQEKARKIGKLQIFSDGTTEMNLGGVVLDVSPGTLSECRHEVGLFSTIDEECIFLGNIADKKVCTPSLKYLYD